MERISKKQAVELFDKDLLELGEIATQAKFKAVKNSGDISFVIDRNVNYTNVCCCKCKFCAFFKEPDAKDAYVLDYVDIKSKIDELVNQGGTQLLLQGGLNKYLPLNYYLKLLKNIRNDFPKLTIHAFSPPEIAFIAKESKISKQELLKLLIDAGLSSIPGGGAEILCDEIRKKISPNKILSNEWLEVMETAHGLGLKTTATMVYGFGESNEHIVEHLFKIRELQDKTGGFRAFIPWSFQPMNTTLKSANKTAFDYLKIIAISRIILDNITNIQASWVTQGLDIAQLSFSFGSNDFGGTMIEENVVKSAGVENKTNADELIYYIKKAEYKPIQRNTAYETIKTF